MVSGQPGHRQQTRYQRGLTGARSALRAGVVSDPPGRVALVLERLRGLHEGSDNGQRLNPRRAGNLVRGGTTRQLANPLPISGDAAWDSALETTWADRLDGRVQSYRSQARSALAIAARTCSDVRRAEAGARASWYGRRALGISEPRGGRLRSCGTSTRHVTCGCRTREVVIGCGVVQLCERCARKYWGRVSRDVATALSARKLPAQRAYLLTLTVPHSGDLVADRVRLAQLFARLGREARRHRWWSAYAATYECTPGTDGKGHMHMHVALLSAWVPYKDVHAHWRRILGQSSYHLHFRYRHGCPIEKAAQYIAKYASKGVDATEFTGIKAGELLAAMYGRRKVTASRGFWVREKRCDCCGERYRVKPGTGRRIHPVASLQREAAYRGLKWDRWGFRGEVSTWPPQRTLPIR